MSQVPTLTIDGQSHPLDLFPSEVQNLVAALAKAEQQFNEQQYELNKTGIFIEAVRGKAHELAVAHLAASEAETGSGQID